MTANDRHAEQLQSIYGKTKPILSIVENTPKYSFDKYPYTNLAEHPIEPRIEVRINY
jgi:hypothetical protein